MVDVEYVRRCKSKTSDDTHDTMHAAIKGHTLCGKELNEMWFIYSQAGRDLSHITCKKCVKVLKSK